MGNVAAGTFLNEAEIEILTGRKYRAHQCKELARRGWIFETDANGRPLISREYFDSRMQGRTAPPSIVRQRRAPNFAALENKS